MGNLYCPDKKSKVRFMGHHVREYSGVFKPTSVSGSLPYQFLPRYLGVPRHCVYPNIGEQPAIG